MNASILKRVFLTSLCFSVCVQGATFRPKRSGDAVAKNYLPPEVTVPEGFEVELVAGPPLVHHPIMAGFDDEGRLIVSETVGLNLKNTELDQQTPNHVTVLEDVNGDGFFDKSVKFADKMTFPQGGLWHDGAVYVCSPPGLWRLEDRDGDGIADKREQIATGFAYTGNAADVHGPFLHPNGRLYWCHGRKGHEVYQNDGETLVSKNKGARIWSCNPDGSDVQVHAGGGMDNPTELTITPEGDILGSVNLFYGRPRGDVLVHWLYGGAYPRHDQVAVVAEFRRTGDLLTEVHNFGHVAVSGLTRYASGAWGKEYRDNVFVTFFNTHKVTRSILTRDGATYRAQTEEFFEAHSDDFHCTDVLEDADGSLLVIDTGGWFRIGCPTSQIAKPELRGAIYRIRKKGAKKIADPRGREIDWKRSPAGGIATLLDDERFAVRDRAMRELARREAGDVETALLTAMNGGTPTARRNAMWVHARRGADSAAAALRGGLRDKDAGVRQAASHTAGMFRNQAAVPRLMAMVRNDQPWVQREAATALGRIGDSRGVTALLDLLSRNSIDRELEHAAIFALIEIGDRKGALDGFVNGNALLKRRTLIALDQMEGGKLDADMVLAFVGESDEALRETAIGIAAQRKDWAAEIAQVVEGWMSLGNLDPIRTEVARELLARQVSERPVRELIGRLLNPGIGQAVAMEALAGSVGAGADKSWEEPIKRALLAKDDAIVARAIAAAGVLRYKAFDEALKKIGEDEARAPLTRVKALAGLSGRGGTFEASVFDLLLTQLKPEVAATVRGEAARMIAGARLSKIQLFKLADAVGSAGPLELPLLVEAFYKSRDPQVGFRFIEGLQNSPGIGNVPPTEIKRLLTRYPVETQEKAGPLLEGLLARRAEEAVRLSELETGLLKGDVKRGEALFHAQKTLCAVCHRIGDKGGRVGPDLTRIGRIRTTRDLLESIVFPSSSIARDFESYSVNMKNGDSHVGVVLRESAEELQIAVVSGQPLKLSRKDVASIQPSSLSLMPQGLDQAMSKQELSDLIAFLKSRQ